MKKIMVSAIALIFLGNIATAQEAKPKEEVKKEKRHGKKRDKKMDDAKKVENEASEKVEEKKGNDGDEKNEDNKQNGEHRKGGKMGGYNHWLEGLKTDLKLTDAQFEKVKARADETKLKMKALRNDETSTPEEKQAKMKELRKSERDFLITLLTPEQKELLKARKDKK
jgi:hypothetical protein